MFTNEKIDRNDRELLKFNIFTANTLRMLIEKYFSLLANFITFVTHYNEKAAHNRTAQTLEFAASFLTHI
jgi:hypothetical protein